MDGDDLLAKAHPGWADVVREMIALHVKKAADYGRGADMLANLRAAAEFGLPAWLGVALRMNDKFHRLKSFAINKTLANEGVEDTLLDLGTYALLALVLYREDIINASRIRARGTDADGGNALSKS